MQFSRFSKQFQPGSGILQLMQDLGEGSRTPGKIHMLGGGNPACIPEMEQVFREQMNELMARGREFEQMIGSYDEPRGNRGFTSALADLLGERFGWALSADNIAITNGSQAAFAIIFNALAGQFDDHSRRKILLPVTPEYIGYADVGIGESPLFTANRPLIERHSDHRFKYRVNFSELSPDTDIGAICVSRPTNPSGNVITDAELLHLQRVAADHRVPLIIDGAYGQPFPGIVFNDVTPVWDGNTILCLSLSKLGLPGVRAGIVIADTPLIDLITGASAINTLAPGRFGPSLVTALVKSGEIMSLSEQVIRPYYQQRSSAAISMVIDQLGDLPVRIHESEGAIFLWLWFEGLPVSSQQLYQRLKQRGVFVIAGEHFFPGLEDRPDQPWRHRAECIRVSYAADEQDVRAGIGIIAEEVRAAYSAKDDSKSS